MADGGNDASGGAPVTSGVIMAAGGQHSDSQRLSKDLEDISASHLTESDCEEELHGEEDEADLEKIPGDGKLQHDLLSHQYGHNTPSKKRSRTPRSAVWNTVKRIKDKALLGPVLRQSDDGRENTTYTHVCIACKQLLKLGYDQKASAWKTTKAFDHFKDSPTCAPDVSAKSEAGQRNRAGKLMGDMMLAGAPAQHAASLQSAGLVLDPVARALTKAARWYIYGHSRIAKETFEDHYFRDMINTYFVLGGGTHGQAPMLTTKGVKKYVDAEFECFRIYVKFLADEMLQFTGGNAFSQSLHDAATLANHHKKLAVGSVSVDPKFLRTHCLCLSMRSIPDGSSVSARNEIDAVHQRAYGRKTSVVAHSMMSDKAALSVAALFQFEKEACGMHQVDKVAASGIGDLVRRRKKQVMNPFPEGQALVIKVHSIAAHFSYGDRWEKLVEEGKMKMGKDKVPDSRLQLDLNTTRVMARWSLIYSCVRQNKILKLHLSTKPDSERLKDAEWQSLAEVEAAMFLSQPASKLVQTEQHPVNAFRWLVFQDLLDGLRSPMLRTIKLDDVRAEPRLPRHEIPEANLTMVGAECKRRMLLEAERRFAGNETEEVTGADVTVTEHDKLSTLLDPRTNNCKHLRGKPAIDVHAMRLALQDEYVKWAMRTREWLGLDSVSEEEDEDEGNAEEVVDEDDIPGLFAPEEKEEPKHVKPSPARKHRPEEAAREAEEQFRKDFDRHWKAYNIRSQSIDWTQVPGVSKPEDRAMIWKDLWSADMSYVMKKFFLDDKECEDKYGHLPKMAVASKGMMGSVMASSFCERINSCANVVCTKNNSLLSDDEIDKVVTLRMNRDFMEFMRAYYPDVIKSTHPKYGSLITADDVKEERVRAQEQEVDMFD